MLSRMMSPFDLLPQFTHPAVVCRFWLAISRWALRLPTAPHVNGNPPTGQLTVRVKIVDVYPASRNVFFLIVRTKSSRTKASLPASFVFKGLSPWIETNNSRRLTPKGTHHHHHTITNMKGINDRNGLEGKGLLQHPP